MTNDPAGRSRPGALRWVLGIALRGRTATLARLACWSMLEASPTYLSGFAIAHALDAGFLAGRALTGLCWLALLAGSVIVAGWGTRRSVLCLAQIVEPVRDQLTGLVVATALDRATRARPSVAAAGVARLTQQTEIVREALAGTLSALRGFALSTVAVVAGLATLRSWLILLVAPPLLVALAALALVLRAQVATQRAQILAEEQVAESATALASGLRDVVACGAERQAHDLVGRHIDAQALAARRSAWLKAGSSLVVGVGGWLPLAMLLVVTPRLLEHGVTPGVIAGAVVYLAHALQPAVQTLVEGLTGAGAWLVTASGRILDVTSSTTALPASPPSTVESTVDAAAIGPQGTVTQASRHGHELWMRGVCFRYGPHSDPVLRDFDFDIPEGDHLAVAGPSGVGKSTLVGLLCGTLRPTTGRVLIDGVPLTGFTPGALAGCRVAVPQEAYIVAGTLRENLTYHRGDTDMALLDGAVDAVGLTPLLVRLGGYDADIGPEALSAGERQLIALARAYLSPAPIAILDEATCHLDPAAEARVERAFARRPGTLVVVAHRISSALRARRILVLDGQRIHIGDHESLLSSSPLYRELVGRWDHPAVAPPVPDPAAASRPTA